MNAKRWIVNAADRVILDASEMNNTLCPGEFFWTGTYADAMEAGARRRLAEEALKTGVRDMNDLLVVVADRIEPRASNLNEARDAIELWLDQARDYFDVWREGTGLVVLGRL